MKVSVWKFSSGKVYTTFVGNLLYRESHKMIPCAVWWKASKTSKLWYTSGWTFREPFDL